MFSSMPTGQDSQVAHMLSIVKSKYCSNKTLSTVCGAHLNRSRFLMMAMVLGSSSRSVLRSTTCDGQREESGRR